MSFKSDIEIAQETTPLKITEVAKNCGVDEKYIEQYGNYKAKIDYRMLKDLKDQPDGKLILVTAITPTPAGEGKTTTSVGLADGLRKIGKKAVVALREPWPRVWHQGRRRGRRLCPGGAHGGHQPALHRRLPRHWCCQQPDGRHAG